MFLNFIFFKFRVLWRLLLLKFPNCHLPWHHDTNLVEKNGYAYESQQSERFKYIRSYTCILSHEQKVSAFTSKWIPDVLVDFWRLHTNSIKLCETLQQITQKRYTTDLRIGEVIYKCVLLPSFWLISLNGFDFIFLLRDSENDFGGVEIGRYKTQITCHRASVVLPIQKVS